MVGFPASIRVALPLLLVAAGAGGSACNHGNDGSHGGGTLAVSFDGDWQGTWSSPALGPSGMLTLHLEQSGMSVTGTATFTGHPCLASCTVSCQVNGHELSGSFGAGPYSMMFSGSCPESAHCSGPHHANTLTADYQLQAGPCSGEVGKIQMTPVPADAGAAIEPDDVYVGEVILLDPAFADVVQLPVFVRPVRAP